jgi:hypothetical protein
MDEQRAAWAEYSQRIRSDLHTLVDTHGSVDGATSWALHLLDYASRAAWGIAVGDVFYAGQNMEELRDIIDRAERFLIPDEPDDEDDDEPDHDDGGAVV